MKLQEAVNRFVGTIVAPALKNQAQGLAIFVACALTLARSILNDLAVEVVRHGYATRLRVVILADRGFHKSRLFVYCQKTMHFDYCIRQVLLVIHHHILHHPGLSAADGFAPKTPRPGLHRQLRQKPPESSLHAVGRLDPEKRDEPWFLATSLKGTPEQIVKLYGRRMKIEQSFRDKKNVNNGWGLRHMRIKTAEGLDRLLLILAIAYLILCGLGLYALKHFEPRLWCSNNRPNECGIFTIARRLLGILQVSLEEILAELTSCSKSLDPN